MGFMRDFFPIATLDYQRVYFSDGWLSHQPLWSPAQIARRQCDQSPWAAKLLCVCATSWRFGMLFMLHSQQNMKTLENNGYHVHTLINHLCIYKNIFVHTFVYWINEKHHRIWACFHYCIVISPKWPYSEKILGNLRVSTFPRFWDLT